MVSRDVLHDKFRRLARAALPKQRIEKFLEAIGRLEPSTDAAESVSLLVAA